jgi:hypothetical protein
MRVMNLVAPDYYQQDGRLVRQNGTALQLGAQFTISDKKNTFTVIGCDTIAYLLGYQNRESSRSPELGKSTLLQPIMTRNLINLNANTTSLNKLVKFSNMKIIG